MGGELYDDLVKQICEKKVVAVVGAGVAIQATGGTPEAGWIGLLRHGVQRIVELGWAPPGRWAERACESLDEAQRGEGDVNTLLGVAEDITQYLGAPDNGEWGRWLENTVGSLKATEAGKEVLAAIAGLGVPIATTNYDGLLESATGDPPVTWEETGAVVKFLNREQAGVLHLHGSWKKPGSVVLGIRDYQRVLGAGTAQHVQRVLPTVHSLLYIGCGAGLSDPNFGKLREWIGETLRTAHHRHFRLAREGPELEAVRKEHDRDERTFALAYGSAFEHLAPFLRELASAAAPPAGSPPPPLPTRAAGPPLWLVERERDSALDLYASAEIGVGSQDHKPGEPLRVRFTGYFHAVRDDLLPLREVRVDVVVPPRLRAEKRLGDGLEHECVNGLRIHCLGPVRNRIAWSLRAGEPDGVLHGRKDNAKPADDAPLFELPGAMIGDRVDLRLVVYPKDFVVAGAALPPLACERLSVQKKRVMEYLRMRKVGRPDTQGEIVLDVSENTVEEAPR